MLAERDDVGIIQLPEIGGVFDYPNGLRTDSGHEAGTGQAADGLLAVGHSTQGIQEGLLTIGEL